MTITREEVLATLAKIAVPTGGTLISLDLVLSLIHI